MAPLDSHDARVPLEKTLVHFHGAALSPPRERWLLPDGERSLDYEAFKDVVRQAGERRVAQGGLVPLPELRRQVPALDRRSFDDYVLTLHGEGAIHLLSHVEPDKLASDVRDAVRRPSLGDSAVLAAVAVTI